MCGVHRLCKIYILASAARVRLKWAFGPLLDPDLGLGGVHLGSAPRTAFGR